MGNYFSKLVNLFQRRQSSHQTLDSIKPINFSWSPTIWTPEVQPNPAFSFLGAKPLSPSENRDFVCVFPKEFGVSWPTSFPASHQCKYWEGAEKGCYQLLREIKAIKSESAYVVPEWFTASRNGESVNSMEKILITTAVDCAISMQPNSSSDRTELLAKINLLLWTHDDVVDYHPDYAGKTVVDSITTELLRIARSTKLDPDDKVCASFKITQTLLDECHGLLRQVLESFAKFNQFTRSERRTEFQNLRDFLTYRTVDIAGELILTCVRYCNRLDLSPEDQKPLQRLADLVMDHITLFNDLVSFDKEKKAWIVDGASLLNTVHYLETALVINSPLAKNLTLHMILDLEEQIGNEVTRLKKAIGLTQTQLHYTQALIECAAGNIFFSLTSIRYGGLSASGWKDN